MTAGNASSAPAFVMFVGGLAVVFGALMVWVELLIRAAAVYVAVLFLPLALASLAWPAIAHWCRRLVDTLVALVLGKFVIVAVLSLAAGALAGGTAPAAGGGTGAGCRWPRARGNGWRIRGRARRRSAAPVRGVRPLGALPPAAVLGGGSGRPPRIRQSSGPPALQPLRSRAWPRWPCGRPPGRWRVGHRARWVDCWAVRSPDPVREVRGRVRRVQRVRVRVRRVRSGLPGLGGAELRGWGRTVRIRVRAGTGLRAPGPIRGPSSAESTGVGTTESPGHGIPAWAVHPQATATARRSSGSGAAVEADGGSLVAAASIVPVPSAPVGRPSPSGLSGPAGGPGRPAGSRTGGGDPGHVKRLPRQTGALRADTLGRDELGVRLISRADRARAT